MFKVSITKSCRSPFPTSALTCGKIHYTGLFISPSGISELDCATTKTDTAHGSMGPWARTACSFRSAQAATLLEFIYHSRIVLSVGGSVWYMIRNLRYIVTIDSVLANAKTQNAFLFTLNAIFCHDYPLAVEPGSTPRPLLQKKLGEFLYLLIWSFLPCLSWLLRSRVRKSRKDLWITLVYSTNRMSENSTNNVGNSVEKPSK